jgi:hypothetical protein
LVGIKIKIKLLGLVYTSIQNHNPRIINFPQINGHQLGDAHFYHGYAVDDVGAGHGALVVCDDDELGFLRKFLDDLVEFVDVGIIEWGIYLIENTEWGGL